MQKKVYSLWDIITSCIITGVIITCGAEYIISEQKNIHDTLYRQSIEDLRVDISAKINYLYEQDQKGNIILDKNAIEILSSIIPTTNY